MIDTTCRYLIDVIKSVICGTSPPPAPTDICWQELTQRALQHSVANIAAYALTSAPKEVFSALNGELQLNLVREARMRVEAEKIFGLFAENGIDFMPMKGFILQDLYPSPDMRTMSDVDILIKTADADKAGAIMKQCGYEARFANSEEDAYLKPPLCSIELHKKMVGAEYATFSRYYSNVWRLAKQTASQHRYEFSDEDFYIYHIVHLAKHYRSCGTGIRSILDIWIYLGKKRDTLNWDYINGELKKLKLLQFTRNAEQLSEHWFDGKTANSTVEKMEEFILGSGTYGSQENYKASQGIKYSGIKKIKYYWGLTFPGIKPMSSVYPILRKVPVLLPFLWIYRIIRGILFKQNTIRGSMNADVVGSEEKNNELKRHLDDVGL